MVLNDTCYKFEVKTSNFKDASNDCINLGGKLFEPKNNYTHDSVYNMATKKMKLNHGAWIGVVTHKTDDWAGEKFIL